ncbi:GNAT family N-acetyltransferase [Oceanospirillum maris]|uniref:GNAT family N-acetyltransferase n=1 Tax=Oceanospirillum maris TaxID=64977 RepID=UPI000427E090|nr:GNAT family N-acetyltransferase [Oceanospirillum maris]
MKIQTYSEEWGKEVADLFYQSVHGIDSGVYSVEEKQAWAPAPINYDLWSERLRVKKPYLAIIDNRVAGFIELDSDGHIDCTYTHPDFQGRGVASSLYEYLIAQAKKAGMARLYVEASHIALPFFEKRGFSLIKKNALQRDGVTLVNFSMEKHLGLPR